MQKFLKGLGLTILTIILSGTALILFLLFPLRQMVSPQNIKDIIASLEIEKISEESPEVEEAIAEMLSPIYEETRKYGIPDEIIVKIIDSDEVKLVFADATSNVLEALLTGQSQKIINADNITELVAKAIDDINATGLYKISTKEKDNVLKVVNEKTMEYEDFLPDTNIIKNNLSREDQKILELVQFIWSKELIIWIITALVVALIGIIFLKRREAKWLKWSAISLLVTSILALIGNQIMQFINFSLFKLDYAPLYNMLAKPLKLGATIAALTMGLMVVVLIIYGLVRHQKSKLAK